MNDNVKPPYIIVFDNIIIEVMVHFWFPDYKIMLN